VFITNTNALNSFKFAPLTSSHSPVGRARGEGGAESNVKILSAFVLFEMLHRRAGIEKHDFRKQYAYER
jgi:hypothetical protein